MLDKFVCAFNSPVCTHTHTNMFVFIDRDRVEGEVRGGSLDGQGIYKIVSKIFDLVN